MKCESDYYNKIHEPLKIQSNNTEEEQAENNPTGKEMNSVKKRKIK